MTLCHFCKEKPAKPRGRFCSRRCRQSAYRLRKRSREMQRTDRPLRIAYADPPYPGTASKYYGDEPTYAGEVDHAELVSSLTDRYDGWALSTSSKALRDVLPLCPSDARVCAWVKPGGVPPATYGLHSKWEAVIVVSGRRLRPGVRDWLHAHPARGGGTLTGRKPLAFCAWLFEILGMMPGDHFEDLFPGTGIVGRAWAELSRTDPDDGSRPAGATRRSSTNDA